MCNRYSITTNQEAIRALFRVLNRYVGNLPPAPGVLRLSHTDHGSPDHCQRGCDQEIDRLVAEQIAESA